MDWTFPRRRNAESFGFMHISIFKSALLAVTLWVVAGLSLTLHAQSSLDSLQYLGAAVVTGQTVRRDIIPVQELSGETLKKLSTHSVADALRFFSGVQIKDYGGVGGLKTVNIRSMGTNHVGVFYDGIELGNAQNGTVDLGKFSLDNMEAITLYNGQKSATLQPAKDFGSSGSIYLQTRTPVFDDGKNYNLRATFKTGSFGLANPSLLWEQRITPEISSSFSAEYMYTTGKYKFTYRKADGYDTTAVRQNGDVNALRVEGGLFGKISDGYWKAKAYFYNSERGYPGAIVRNKFSHEDRQWDANFFTQGTFKKDFTDWYTLLANAKYAYDYLHYLADPRKDESIMYTDNRYWQQEVYLSVANRFIPIEWLEASVSADWQFNALDSDMREFAYPVRNTFLVSAAASAHLGPVSMQASLLGTFVHDRTVKFENTHKFRLTPAVFVSWKPFKKVDLDIRAFYKKIFRMPTLNDLYYTFIGNASLKPEFTTQYNLGGTYTYRFRSKWVNSLQFQADAYLNNVTDKIIATPTSNFFRWTMVNLGKVRILGTDLAAMAEFDMGRSFAMNARVNYTYQSAINITDPSDAYYGDQIPYIPWHSASFALNASWWGWEAGLTFIYTGERYSADANIPENYQQPWYTTDFKTSKAFAFAKSTLKLTLEVNNLFNQQYEVVSCYPMPGINFRVIAQYNF